MRVIATVAAFLFLNAALPSIAQQPQSNQPGQAASGSGELDMAAIPNLNQAGIRQVQLALQKKGFDPGPIDGVLGARTREAVRSFQEYYGIKASGQIDNQTLYALGETQLAGRGG
jgi:peptidoglycan hydrolase-like protein with peptidoglycan-binding domain